ncbi:hypothetical protein FIBSPDRAFT_685114, partial [Athelia psychrophila]
MGDHSTASPSGSPHHLPTMVTLTPASSILTMPIASAKIAPRKFTGNYHKVRAFLIHYELLLEQHNIHNGKDRCELITRYVSDKVSQFIQALDSYNSHNWPALQSDILKYYDADKDTKKYRPEDLTKLVLQSKKQRIRNLAEWRHYGRKFITIGGWLLRKTKITTEVYATQYWSGIPRSLREKLENRLVANNPARSLVTPLSVAEINSAAEGLLQRDRFDSHFANSGSDSDDSDSDSGGNGSDSSDSSDDLKTRRRRITKKAKYHKGKGKVSVSQSESSSSEEDAPVARLRGHKSQKIRVSGKSEPEIDSMIKELNSMSAHDPSYAVLVLKAMRIDPNVLKVVRAPESGPAASVLPMPVPPPASVPYYPPRIPFQRQGPPHMQVPPQGPPLTCYGCNRNGHVMAQCPGILELEASGAMRRDEQGRMTLGNGNMIRRFAGEPLIDAVKRATSAYTPQQPVIDYYEDYPVAEEPDLLAAAVVDSWGRNQMSYVFPAERVEKRTLTKRKEVMDGVYVPARAKTGPSKHTPQRSGPKAPVPIDTERPEFDGQNDDHIIEANVTRQPLINHQQVRSLKKAPAVAISGEIKDTAERRLPAIRQSEITSYTRPMNIMNQILNTRIELCVGEVLGISKEIAGMISDKMKSRVQRSINPGIAGLPIATSVITDQGTLIKLHMQCEGPPFKAIIDTGSMVNIVSQLVCDEGMSQKVDYTKTMKIADANGGSGVLRGLLTDVALFCGNLCTPADLYVKEGAPFDMLLGRPWQRENLITIDERVEGTYIIF